MAAVAFIRNSGGVTLKLKPDANGEGVAGGQELQNGTIEILDRTKSRIDGSNCFTDHRPLTLATLSRSAEWNTRILERAKSRIPLKLFY